MYPTKWVEIIIYFFFEFLNNPAETERVFYPNRPFLGARFDLKLPTDTPAGGKNPGKTPAESAPAPAGEKSRGFPLDKANSFTYR
jgi:hypothetical protein